MQNYSAERSYWDALNRGFQFAREIGRTCGPVHFLVGIAEGTGAAADALAPSVGVSLRGVVADDVAALGQGASYLHGQVQAGARTFADHHGTPVTAEHLLIAVLDQATPQVLAALQRAGIDSAPARRATLAAIDLPSDLPPLELPALTAAGTLDRPPLPVTALDSRALVVLGERHAHLPLLRIRGASSWHAMAALEERAAWRLASRLSLDDDQRYSLLTYHRDEVAHRMAEARPDLAPPPASADGAPSLAFAGWVARRRPPRWLRFTVGWGTWFRNRQVGVRDWWFRLTTWRHYRAVPRH